MVQAARHSGVALVAGMILRQFPGPQAARMQRLWESVGRIRQIRAAYGHPLDWPLRSLSLFDRSQVGGGVLLDLGVHLIDAIVWILEVEQMTVARYADDGEEGVEAEAEAELQIHMPRHPGPIPCRIETSRLRSLSNCLEVIGERASLRIPLSSTDGPELSISQGTGLARIAAVVPRHGVACFAEQLVAFARRVRGLEADLADGDSQVPVLTVIEACYHQRRPLHWPWDAYRPWDAR